MDVHATRGNGRMLRRMIALLCALAVLAERVAGRSLPVRFLVLWILRRAETAAKAFVFEEAGVPPVALEATAIVGDGPDDALGLAARFHRLAAFLRALLPLDCPFGRRPTPRRFACGVAAPGCGRRESDRTRKPFDTS